MVSSRVLYFDPDLPPIDSNFESSVLYLALNPLSGNRTKLFLSTKILKPSPVITLCQSLFLSCGFADDGKNRRTKITISIACAQLCRLKNILLSAAAFGRSWIDLRREDLFHCEVVRAARECVGLAAAVGPDGI